MKPNFHGMTLWLTSIFDGLFGFPHLVSYPFMLVPVQEDFAVPMSVVQPEFVFFWCTGESCSTIGRICRMEGKELAREGLLRGGRRDRIVRGLRFRWGPHGFSPDQAIEGCASPSSGSSECRARRGFWKSSTRWRVVVQLSAIHSGV